MDEHHGEAAVVKGFTRPRYFHGQLLDVRHFEREQTYFKRKLWMLNRLVSGYGVVCGLDVQVGPDDRSVVVTPGLALDPHGREIVVPRPSTPIAVAPVEARPYTADGGKPEGRRHDDSCDDDWVRLVICFEECRTEPEPVLAGDCDTPERSSYGAVRETYELRLEPGKAPDVSVDPAIPNLIKGTSINYRALAEWVSAPCEPCAHECVTLANIRRPVGDATVELTDIDISVRPIVYGLDVLWELILSLTHDTQPRRGGKH